MAVLAIGITGALGAISACLRSSDAAAGYSRGVLLAQQVAAELERQETLDPAESLSGRFDDLAAGYTWQAEVASPTESGGYPVHITVDWDQGRRHFTLDAMLHPHAVPTAAPAQAPSGNGTAGSPVAAPANPGGGAMAGSRSVTTPATAIGVERRGAR